jgi:internalin A
MDFAMSDGDTVAAHLWDFGGQEVMHATHQFFLSQRSVYVLLLNSRNDDQAEKWLKYAASFGGRSPVLVVLNKIDENPSFEVNRKTLREKYPQIREFYKLSCKIKSGIDDFREALRREIENADTRRTPFPAHWLAVKEHFSNMKAPYIESEEYQRACEKAGVTRAFSQDVLLKFLHDLGVVINFRNLKNFDTQILNPLWLTNGVYRIINSERVVRNRRPAARKRVRRRHQRPALPRRKYQQTKPFHYPKNKLQYIVRVMQEFELCFHLNAHTYVVPQLLPVQEPDVPMEGAVLRFVIHFPDFLPDSLFPRLMVKLHTYIEGDRRWRTGMVLHQPNIFKASARVRWDKEDRKILVDVCGEERRRFLSFIRETVKEIVETFSSLSYSELVPIPDSTDTEEYEYLVEAEKAGEKEVFVKSLKKRVFHRRPARWRGRTRHARRGGAVAGEGICVLFPQGFGVPQRDAERPGPAHSPAKTPTLGRPRHRRRRGMAGGFVPTIGRGRHRVVFGERRFRGFRFLLPKRIRRSFGGPPPRRKKPSYP